MSISIPKRLLTRLGIGLTFLLLLFVGGFVLWAQTPLGPMPEALTALTSDSTVRVSTRPYMVFEPQATEPTLGLILYPGGRVDPRSYAPLAHQIAAQGYLVIIPPMPLNLAVFNPNAAAEIMAAYPQTLRWVIGGHSLGGAMAANYVFTHPEDTRIVGLLLWASYPAENNPLRERNLPVLSIYGTADMGRAAIEASPSRLPSATRWVIIEGGNHAQFGWYGPQPGDGTATLSREAQQMQILEATLEFLHTLERP